MKPMISIREAMDDDAIFGRFIGGASWKAWRALLCATMGEPLTDHEMETFREVTGRDVSPSSMVAEGWFAVGRRGGKSLALSVLTSYLGGLCDHTDSLAINERGALPVMASSMLQAKKVFQYVDGVFAHSAMLADQVANRTESTISLKSGVDIEIRAANYRTIRGLTCVAALIDEVAFLNGETSVNPDRELINAIRPALATTGGPLIAISSPYSRRGVLWEAFKRHHGPNGDPAILVANGPSRTFNPTLAQSVVDRAMAEDPASAAAEYMGQFRSDIESFIGLESIEAVTVPDRFELPRQSGVTYRAFVDLSGGSSDSSVLAIAHCEGETAILDCLREIRPPFSPEVVVQEFATVMRAYGVSAVEGDRYAGEWPRERFTVHGIRYEPSSKAKSDIYKEFLPLVNSARVELLDIPRLAAQFVGLERRTARGGRDSIDHAPGAHDDAANAAAGALVSVGTNKLDVQKWVKAYLG